MFKENTCEWVIKKHFEARKFKTKKLKLRIFIFLLKIFLKKKRWPGERQVHPLGCNRKFYRGI